MNLIFKNSILTITFLAFLSCQGKQENVNIDYNKIKEPLINANKQSVDMENKQIEGYIKRRGWDMKETGTGLRYMIYEQGKGERAEIGKIAKVHYEVSLINGTTCYSTKNKEPEEFLIGMDQVESGLHEGITYLQEGDKAKLILPSHLAYGLIGDQDKIPSKATIIYDIHLIEVKDKL